MSEKQQQLVFAIIEFLNQTIQDGTVKADDQEGLEVASVFFPRHFHPVELRLTSASPVHRRGLWRRPHRRGAGPETISQARHPPEHIRRLHKDPPEGRIPDRVRRQPRRRAPIGRPLSRGQGAGREGEADGQRADVREGLRRRDRVVRPRDCARPDEPRLLLEPRRRILEQGRPPRRRRRRRASARCRPQVRQGVPQTRVRPL